ncbi:sensor histidine kinase [Streptomyces sp. NBRC 110611]|uniref:sensor histidine kinase n=1 Tax=Streptomyces sp. NBRC 110611 TaxID=1621259 RepID=UPI0009A0129F|nr:sensor histidine kinase [Streptomyces sp. NBRC 110611]
MHLAFFLLLAASLARFLLRHPGQPRTPWIVALGVALALLYVLGPVLGPRTDDERRPTARRLLWLGAVVSIWAVLVVLAPSFAWCAVPLFYTGLRTLPTGAASVLVGLLTAFVMVAQMRLSTGFDPNLLLAPPAIAALATAVFVHMERQTARQRALVDDLLRTRRELAATERREGTLAERQRLSMEIHDTLAQGLSSQQMLLQAAERTWDAAPDTARGHIRTATEITARNLAEARRFVHDLAPADLADGASLPQALRQLAARANESALEPAPASAPAAAPGVLSVRLHVDGTPAPLPDRVQSALLRIAQGALANVREHAAATTVALTLTYLGDQIVLDIADDGRGFTPAGPGTFAVPGTPAGPGTSAGPVAPAAPGRERGHGLPAMRARVRQLGGTLTVESAPGEGTVLSAAIPLEPTP